MQKKGLGNFVWLYCLVWFLLSGFLNNNIEDVPNIWIEISTCTQMKTKFICMDIPKITLVAENISNEDSSFKILGKYGNRDFSCDKNICEILLTETDLNGEELVFYAARNDKRLGSDYWALVRVYRPSDTNVSWTIDIISNQLKNVPIFCCAVEWGSFVPEFEEYPWGMPAQNIKTKNSYYYLASSLIKNGLVNAGTCFNGGLENNYYANQCGHQIANQVVLSWQNRFDEEIIISARKASISPVLLKAIISQESQFWPADINGEEFGFGHITRAGIDSVLLWSPQFFEQTYKDVYGTPPDEKQVSYGLVSDYALQIIAARALEKATVSCIDCKIGIDLSKTQKALDVVAFAIAANAHQAGQVIWNATGMRPGEISTYDDLWRFTLVNYNAGPQCLYDAIDSLPSKREKITFLEVSQNLSQGCEKAESYVDQVFSK